MPGQKPFLRLNSRSKVVNVLFYSNLNFNSQPNYIAQRSFTNKRHLLKSSVAFHYSQRLLYGNNGKEIANGIEDANAPSTFLAAENALKFQALIKDELETAKVSFDNIKKQAIDRFGYISLPIQSIDANRIRFSLRQVVFSTKKN